MNGLETAIWTVLIGASSGCGYALLGWLKGNSTKPENWSAAKFLPTVAWGAVVGAMAAYKGWSIDTAEAYAAVTGAVVVFDLVMKMLTRTYAARAKRFFGW